MSGLRELKTESLCSGNSVLVLVVGFHGVGKSSLIQLLKDEFPDSYCVSASSLLSWTSKLKIVADVVANQIKLVATIKELQKIHSFIILDGHLCILNNNHEYEFVGMDVIQAVNPSIIILVSADIDIIDRRLSKRDGLQSLSISHIKDGFNLEWEWAHKVSQQLQIPLFIVNSENRLKY